MKGKFQCTNVSPSAFSKEESVRFSAISTVSDPKANEEFAGDSTPIGTITLVIANEKLKGYFEPGKEYTMTLEPVGTVTAEVTTETVTEPAAPATTPEVVA